MCDFMKIILLEKFLPGYLDKTLVTMLLMLSMNSWMMMRMAGNDHKDGR